MLAAAAMHAGWNALVKAGLDRDDALVMALVVLATRGAAGLARPPGGLPIVVLGAAMSFVACWAAIWTMSVAPIGLLASLRESSILFAAAFSVLFLGERASGRASGATFRRGSS